MNILFSLYPSNTWSFGGKERHIFEMYSELKKLDINVTLHNIWEHHDAQQYDILHVFGSEYYQHELVARAKARGLQVVVSSILVYKNQRHEQIARFWKYIDSYVPISTTYRLRKQTLQLADQVICTSQHEAAIAQYTYGVLPENITVIPWGVSPDFTSATSDLFEQTTGLNNIVLSVGRIEPRKNVLAVIHAMKGLGLPLVIIGDYDLVYKEYCSDVEKEIQAHSWITHIPSVHFNHPLLASAYAAAKVHVLASHQETLGLVSLEAALGGANIVTSPLPCVVEYLKDYVWYANPNDISIIRKCIQEAYQTPFRSELRTHTLEQYSNTVVAQQIHNLYARLMDKV